VIPDSYLDDGSRAAPEPASDHREAKPKAWAPEYAEWFTLASLTDRYDLRPPYPAQTFDVLALLVDASNQSVLDAGCGLGGLARPLARLAPSVDAVDRSEAMLARVEGDPGGPCVTGRRPHLQPST
jgi:2-polyprenyl-3-methyl-5-hydroxy-6-metoxy-1,4-benzoquinol methylase